MKKYILFLIFISSIVAGCATQGQNSSSHHGGYDARTAKQ